MASASAASRACSRSVSTRASASLMACTRGRARRSAQREPTPLQAGQPRCPQRPLLEGGAHAPEGVAGRPWKPGPERETARLQGELGAARVPPSTLLVLLRPPVELTVGLLQLETRARHPPDQLHPTEASGLQGIPHPTPPHLSPPPGARARLPAFAAGAVPSPAVVRIGSCWQGERPSHRRPSLPPPASLPPQCSPPGLCLLLLLSLLGPALPLSIHALEHGIREVQVPRLQHTGYSVQGGHLGMGDTGQSSVRGLQPPSSQFTKKGANWQNHAPKGMTITAQLPPKGDTQGSSGPLPAKTTQSPRPSPDPLLPPSLLPPPSSPSWTSAPGPGRQARL